MAVNIHQLARSRTNWPAWKLRAKIKRVNAEGNLIPNEYACGGEAVRVSPRFVKNGVNFRVRPENPALFFALYCYERGVLPIRLSPAECQEEWALEILDEFWEENKHRFPKLESPFAASDTATTPSPRTGFSFNIPQFLVEPIGTVHSSKTNGAAAFSGPVPTNGENHEALRKKIEELRAKAGRPEGNAPAKGKK
jgi:hypothetical protein